MKPLEWVLIQYGKCPYKKRHIEAQIYTERRTMPCEDTHMHRNGHVNTEAEIGVIVPKDKELDYMKLQRQGRFLSCKFHRKYRPADILILYL